MDEEEWRDIIGYEGIYQVSSFGRIARIDRGTPRIRSLKNGNGEHITVTLSKDGQRWSCSIHRLVATTFFGSRPSGYVIHHRDGNPLNNHAANLEWTTQSNNIRHGIRWRNPKFLPPWWLAEQDANEKL